eukprot:CAMPEP_0206505034 /NCGR_PEP_ID=MMETSP0324_2-20121206/55870_1 /ASSEMBLY_ACC=CAM_ASM_000836 /TAXON_ID=2866 /ORGANISM="Crypthecodinium cohnii, Strain Seligo" /LENGTH=119 /DNA_ID=CAMNT_0053994377 /DNA_START=5 /DNA_END=361 /DNA_ORIENTATION=+
MTGIPTLASQQSSLAHSQQLPAERRKSLDGLFNNNRIMVFHDLRLLPDLSECSRKMLQKFELHLCLRLYLPEQVIMRQGDEMPLMYILQHGTCTMDVFGTEASTVHGPCVLGKLLSLLT